MLARGALCRLAADVPKTSTHDLPKLAHLLQRSLLSRNALTLPAVCAISRAYKAALAESRRSYATTATAKATKPTPTVKKAVKKAVAKKTPVAKKTAAKKKAPAKKPTKRATAAKTKPKKKVAAKKPAKPKRVKKVLTEEQKKKKLITDLRVKALREPTTTTVVAAWHAFVKELLKGQSGGSAEKAASFKDAGAKYKSLTPAEKEHYNHLANEQTVAKRKQYQAWVHTYTPEQIRLANNARARLRVLLKGNQKSRPAHTHKIIDDRHVKTIPTPYLKFSKERHASGDMKGIPIAESSKLLGAEWRALTAGEKKKYQDEYAAEKAARPQAA